MLTREEITDAVSEFKRTREAAVEADSADFKHHLHAFVRQLERNPLCVAVIGALPPYDVDAWWARHVGDGREHRRIDKLDLPDSKDEQLQIYLDLVRAFVSDDSSQVSIAGFGSLLGKHKSAEAVNLVQSMVLRPLVEEMTNRLRKSAALANPDIRELAGVPLSRIPGEKEIGIFLSHRSTNKNLVDRYFSALKELGFSPWYDKEAMAAGDTVHRALESGMDTSCAAVFFITPEFQDERWMGREVDLAMQRKINLNKKFTIITLVFGAGKVPRSLNTFRYVPVEHERDRPSAPY